MQAFFSPPDSVMILLILLTGACFYFSTQED